MTKEKLKQKLEAYDDAVVIYRSPNSKKVKYNVCTLNFDNDYISSKPNKITKFENDLLTFSWDADAFRILKPQNVISVIALSSMLKSK